MPSKSKNYNILLSMETVNLDDGVEAVTQPRKPKISPPFRCTKRFRLLAVIGGLVAFVAVLNPNGCHVFSGSRRCGKK